MDFNYLLTVIIPCFNGELYIQRCLSSLDALPEDEVGILIINDGSTDSSQMILEKWVLDKKNAKLINKDNGGYCSAINCGLDNCHSEYVMFMGIDDELIAPGINKICKMLKRNKPDLLFFSTIKVFDDDNGRREDEILTHYESPGFYNNSIVELCKNNKRDSRILFCRDTSRCFKMSIIEDLRYFGKIGVSADGVFSSLVAYKSSSFEFENVDCYIWHLHKNSVSSRPQTFERILDESEVFMNFFKKLQSLHSVNKIPEIVLGFYYKYRNNVDSLISLQYIEKVSLYKESLEETKIWLIQGRYVTLKSLLRILFPRLYNMYAYAIRKWHEKSLLF